MSCIIDNGYTLGCQSVGGVEKVWIGTYNADATYTLDVDNQITAATGLTGANGVYLMEQDMEFAGLEQTGTFTRENGTVHYESVLSLRFIELNKDLRNLILSLGKAPIYAVVKSNAGHYYFLGRETAGRATEGVASLGVAMGDLNGANLSFTFKSQNGAFLLDDGALVGTDIEVLG